MEEGIFMALIKCNECGKEVSDKATACPNCGCPINTNYNSGNSTINTRSKPKKKTGCLISVLIFVLLMVAGIVSIIFTGKQINDTIQQEISGTSSDDEYISLNEYNQIETGMSYDEVKEIVGSAGTISSQVESGGYKIIIVTWYGNGVAGSNANVTFTNDEVTAKAQVGLINDESENTSEKTVVDTDIASEETDTEGIAVSTEDSAPPETVQMTIPGYFVDTFDMDVPEADFIVKKYRNEDNALVVVFCDQGNYESFIEGFRYSIIKNLEEIRTRENSPLDSIEYNDNLTYFTLSAHSKDFTSNDFSKLAGAMIMSACYQNMLGIPEEDVDVVITAINSLSGYSEEIISWKTAKEQYVQTPETTSTNSDNTETANSSETVNTDSSNTSGSSEIPRTSSNPKGLDPKTYKENIVYFNDISAP